MTVRAQPSARATFKHLQAITTRWSDNDVYGHMNNVVHYSLFDTAVNRLLVDAGVLDLHHGAVIGLVVRSHCDYFDSLAFPQTVWAGIAVVHLGRSSVRYRIALFADQAVQSAATGEFTHVYVDRTTRRPLPLPPPLVALLQPLLMNQT
jgi:acyl-CoA thioester hydrolase